MIFLVLVMGIAAGWWFMDMYRLSGLATGDRLPRVKLRNRITVWRSYRQAKRTHMRLMRASLLKPHEQGLQVDRAQSEALLMMCRAVLDRDAKLTVAAAAAMERLLPVELEHAQVRAMSQLHRRMVGAAKWN
jgi:hypothetical protein